MTIWLTRIYNALRAYYRKKSIQFTISIAFTVVSIICMVAMGLLLYAQSFTNLRTTTMQDNQQILGQVSLNLTYYMRNMLRISDSLYASISKNRDESAANSDVPENETALLYEINRDSIISIACFNYNGECLFGVPSTNTKKDVSPETQDWFVTARNKIENPHFSLPHVQNLFDNSISKYNWVISLSRMVTLTDNGRVTRGVLLVDMKYSGIEQVFTELAGDGPGYVYLADQDGNLIYHPKQKMIQAGLFEENTPAITNLADGTHEYYNNGGQKNQAIVKTVSYTGWKLVSVVPESVFNVNSRQMRLFAFGIIALTCLLLITINAFVSTLVAKPIKQLDQSVKNYENDADLNIFIGGPYEIEHLGKTIQAVVLEMRQLLDGIIHEQELKRKSEFDALQSQINPHFLYNTLDSIVWMIEDGRQSEAVSMVTALASLFRISLSSGKNIITIRSEVQHVKHYLYIQKIRYKNKFDVKYDIDPDMEECSTIKLILQPLVENAIYHAMEYMDGDGLITIRGYGLEDDLFLEVSDNGLGMTKEKADSLLEERPSEVDSADTLEKKRRGSGIGLRNVHQRIRLYYGEEYGLSVHSELDVGTTIRIHLPRKNILDFLMREDEQ